MQRLYPISWVGCRATSGGQIIYIWKSHIRSMETVKLLTIQRLNLPCAAPIYSHSDSIKWTVIADTCTVLYRGFINERLIVYFFVNTQFLFPLGIFSHMFVPHIYQSVQSQIMHVLKNSAICLWYKSSFRRQTHLHMHCLRTTIMPISVSIFHQIVLSR